MAIYQVNNFTGNLTRKPFGSLNSGLVRIGKSYGIDPFTNPTSISFNEVASNLDPSHATITDLIIDGDFNQENGVLYLYCVDRSGTVYKINTETDAITIVTNSLGISLAYGGGLRIIKPMGETKIIISHNTGWIVMFTDGTSVVNNQPTFIFNGTDADVSTVTSYFNLSNITEQPDPGILASLLTGMPCVYLQGSNPITPLVSGQTYYLIVIGTETNSFDIQLATTQANALKGIFIPITFVGSPSAWSLTNVQTWLPNIPHPISNEYFEGIFIGNGSNLVDYNYASNTTKFSRLSPSFPWNFTINALEVDSQGRYMRINGTTGSFQDIITQDPTAPSQAPTSRALYWNGIDESYDSYDALVQSNTSSMFSFLGYDMILGQDFWGFAIYQNSNGTPDKMLSMKEVRPPLPGSITADSNLLFFAAPYYSQNAWRCGIFGVGTLDDQDQPGIYSLMGISSGVTATGMLKIAQNRFLKSDGTMLTDSKFYVATYENGAANFYSFNLTPGTQTPSGVYETQKEKMQLLQHIDRIVIYLNSTQSGMGFQLDIVDADDTIPSGGTFNYTFATGSDDTQLQGALEVIEWTADNVKDFQAFGIRLTPTGTVQPNINQIIIETHTVDKASVNQNT